MQVLEKPGQGKLSPGKNLFGSTRQMCSMALMAKGNESYVNIGAVKLREMKPNASISETSPNKY